jgi:hypothetical protein
MHFTAAMPLLATIGDWAFSYFKGKLTIDAGACPLLTSIGNYVFYSMSNPASTISISRLTNLATIGDRAFYYFRGILELQFASLNQLSAVGTSVFTGTTNTQSYVILPNSGYERLQKQLLSDGFAGQVFIGASTTTTTTATITTTTIAPGAQCSSTDTFHNTTDADRAAAAAAAGWPCCKHQRSVQRNIGERALALLVALLEYTGLN